MRTLHPEVLAELEAESTARRRKDAELSVGSRINTLEARLVRLEMAPRPNSASLDENFWGEVTAAFRGFVESHVKKLKAENAALEARIKSLECRPPLKYCGVWIAGKTYPENSLVTRDGSLWIARRSTAAYPGGGAEPDSWQLCVKRGADGKDAK
jgi:hypothetical protein